MAPFSIILVGEFCVTIYNRDEAFVIFISFWACPIRYYLFFR